jgi:hypothetical protein
MWNIRSDHTVELQLSVKNCQFFLQVPYVRNSMFEVSSNIFLAISLPVFHIWTQISQFCNLNRENFYELIIDA